MSKTHIVKIKYKPRKEQKIIHEDKSLYRVIVAHRRLGKTTAALNEVIKAALENPNKRYWFVAPNYRQAKNIAIREIKQFLPKEFVLKKNEQELTFDLVNGTEIALKGAENADTLRGAGLHGVVFDEFQEMDKEVWEDVISPMLAEAQLEGHGWAIFLGTPKGRNYFYELYKRGESKDPKWQHWSSHRWSAYDTKIFGKNFIDQKKEEMSENAFRQEYLAEFIEGSGTVFRGIKDVTTVAIPETGLPPKWDETYQMGVDVARLLDWTVLTVVNHRMEVVYFERFQKLDWDLQKTRILDVSYRYHNCPVMFDASGIGDPLFEDLLNMGGNMRPFKITRTSKKTLIENLQIRIEQKQISIPNIPQIIDELEAYTFSTSPAGGTIYKHPSGFHDDCVISLALAVWELLPQSYLRRKSRNIYANYQEDY